jgi:hypothetical protein
MSVDLEGVPSDLVRNLLLRGSEVAGKAAQQAASYSENRAILRAAIETNLQPGEPGIWSLDDAIINEAPESEICAVDGANICDNRAIGDLCAAVAVSLGTAPGNMDNALFLDSVPRSVHNRDVTSGIMSSLEIELASKAKGDVILLDGALIATLINISKAISSGRQMGNSPLAERISQSCTPSFRDNVMTILSGNRFMTIPKYVTKNEFAAIIPEQFRTLDERTIATMALKAGELTRFKVSGSAENKSNLDKHIVGEAFGFSKNELADVTYLIEGIHSCYYKPHPWTPAFRIDIPLSVAQNYEIQARILRAIRDSTRASGMQEPLPQYLVDLFAKQISVGASAVVEMSALSSIDDPEARLLMAMGYRT